MFSFKHRIVTLIGLTAATMASALPTTAQIFTAENVTPNYTVTSDVALVRGAFLNQFSSPVTSFGFERPAAIAGDTGPFAVDFAGSNASKITATINGNGTVVSGIDLGRYNTTAGGNQYWRVRSGVTGTFSIDFSSAISAFGFYGTDIGDFEGTVTMSLTRASDGGIDQLIVHDTISLDGSLLFYGFVDAKSAYTKITFSSTGLGTDFFGFDDFVVADARQIKTSTGGGTTPEPGSLALVGLGLLTALWSRQYGRNA